MVPTGKKEALSKLTISTINNMMDSFPPPLAVNFSMIRTKQHLSLIMTSASVKKLAMNNSKKDFISSNLLNAKL